MGSTFSLWEKRLRTETILTRGQIGQFCRSIGAGSIGYEIGGANNNLTPDECVTLMEQFRSREGGYGLTMEHTQFGWDWIGKNYDRALSLGITREMVETFKGFMFVDIEDVDPYRFSMRGLIVPVYRVLSGVGTIDYSWSPWQQRTYA